MPAKAAGPRSSAAKKLDAAQAAVPLRDIFSWPLPCLGYWLPIYVPATGRSGFRHDCQRFAGHAQAATIRNFRQTHSMVLCNALRQHRTATQHRYRLFTHSNTLTRKSGDYPFFF